MRVQTFALESDLSEKDATLFPLGDNPAEPLFHRAFSVVRSRWASLRASWKRLSEICMVVFIWLTIS